jgi:hypothetical protein
MDTLRFFIIAIPVTFFLFIAADFLAGIVQIFANSFKASTVEVSKLEDSKATPPSAPIPTSQDEVLSFIRTLKKRDLRKILMPLGIQQKRNGVEISTQMAIAQISRIYKEDSAKVIAVIREKLPNKLSSPTNPSVPAETA